MARLGTPRLGSGALWAALDARHRTVTSLDLTSGAAVLGTGVPGHVNGAIVASTFNEPLALAYANGILLVGCYGGEAHGTVSTIQHDHTDGLSIKLLKVSDSGDSI